MQILTDGTSPGGEILWSVRSNVLGTPKMNQSEFYFVFLSVF